MALQHSYQRIAPFYDTIVARATKHQRQISLAPLSDYESSDILINGIGSGLDIPFLAPQHRYTGIDLTPAMLDKAQQRLDNTSLELSLQQGDSTALPYSDEQFDHVVDHLIIAVVDDPQKAFNESLRVLKPGGRLYILDKFLKPNQFAPIRRLMNPLMRRIATQTTIVFEQLCSQTSYNITIKHDEGTLLNGCFRRIVIEKQT